MTCHLLFPWQVPSSSADRAVKHNAAYSADRCQLNSRKLCKNGRFDSRLLTSNPPSDLPTYGVAEGEADSEADGEASASAFFLAAFLGEADAEGEASVVAAPFLVVAFSVVAVVFFAPVFLAVVVVAVPVVAAVSCFCAQEVTNARPIRAVIKDKTDFFIGCG